MPAITVITVKFAIMKKRNLDLALITQSTKTIIKSVIVNTHNK